MVTVHIRFKKEKSEIRRNKYRGDWGVEIRSLNTNCGRSIGFKTVFCFQVFWYVRTESMVQ